MTREERELDDTAAYPLVPVIINNEVDCDPQAAFMVGQHL